MIRTTTIAVLLAVLTAGLAHAQDWQKREDKLSRDAITRLLAFAQTAERNKVRSRAKEAYELILKDYDPDNDRAHRELGHKKENGVWKVPDIQEDWPDDANDEQRFRVIDEWKHFAEIIGALHRELGLEMLEKNPERAKYHLEMALYYNPFDVEAHKGLGHKQDRGVLGDRRGHCLRQADARHRAHRRRAREEGLSGRADPGPAEGAAGHGR